MRAGGAGGARAYRQHGADRAAGGARPAANLEMLGISYGCPRLAALYDLQRREGLPALLAHLAAQGEPAPAPGVEPELDDSTWATLHDLGQREGMPALLAHLAAQSYVL